MAARSFLILIFTVLAIDAQLTNGLRDVKTRVGSPFEYVIGDDKFQSSYKINRVVENRKRQLPDWLSFTEDTWQLVGVPLEKDIGVYNIKVRVICRDPLDSCKNRTLTFDIQVIKGRREAVNGENPDTSPVLNHSIDSVLVHVGRYFEYQIPVDMFSDVEDGSTRNLTLSVSLGYGMPLPSRAWLSFNSSSQTLYGIPLLQDIKDTSILTVTLTAEDSTGQTVKDLIHLTYNKSHLAGNSHKISVTYIGNFQKFDSDRDNLVDMAWLLAKFYEDNDLEYFTFHSISSGSVNVEWSNNSFSSIMCERDNISEVFDKLVDVNGSVSLEFVSFMSRDFVPLLASLEFTGICKIEQTTIGPAKTPLAPSPADSKLWIEVVLPALVTILVLILIALILLVFCRHRRSNKDLSPSDKPTFLEDRRPIIFPEELEMVDPSLKHKQPLVLPADYLTNRPPASDSRENVTPPRYLSQGMEDDDVFVNDGNRKGITPPPPTYGSTNISDPPPYRLPPPYFNPHRV